MLYIFAAQTVGTTLAEGSAQGWGTGTMVGAGISVLTVVGGGIAWLLAHIDKKEETCRLERTELRKQITDITAVFTAATDRQTERFIQAVAEDRREHRKMLRGLLRRELNPPPPEGGTHS